MFDEFSGSVSESWIVKIGETAVTLARQSIPDADELSVVGIMIADDATVRDLNNTYRGLDENTDVLSFSSKHQGEYYGDEDTRGSSPPTEDFILPPGEQAGMSEVIISYPQAERQATDAGHTIDREIALLVTHGILHLAGYDHVEPEDEENMKRQEAVVLAQVLEHE